MTLDQEKDAIQKKLDKVTKELEKVNKEAAREIGNFNDAEDHKVCQTPLLAFGDSFFKSKR